MQRKIVFQKGYSAFCVVKEQNECRKGDWLEGSKKKEKNDYMEEMKVEVSNGSNHFWRQNSKDLVTNQIWEIKLHQELQNLPLKIPVICLSLHFLVLLESFQINESTIYYSQCLGSPLLFAYIQNLFKHKEQNSIYN